MKATSKQIKLDHSKLLGFNQTAGARGSKTMVGKKPRAMVGGKPVAPSAA